MSTASLNRNLVLLGVPFALFAVLIFLAKTLPAQEINTLNLAISADLLLTIPFIYLLLIRKTAIPKTTVVPMMVLGLLIGSQILPKDSQQYLILFKNWALPVIELFVMGYVIMKVRSFIKKHKKAKDITPDFFTASKTTCQELMPQKLASLLASEIGVLYYGFIDWQSKKTSTNEFTYHKDSGTPALFGVIIFLIGIETFALHILLIGWNLVIAWIISGLSIYTAIQVLGFAKSLSKRPITINENSLNIRYGILNEVDIELSDIESIECSAKSVENIEGARKLSPLGELESHNVIIKVRKEHELTGVYGLKKKFSVLALHVDDAKRFVEQTDLFLNKD